MNGTMNYEPAPVDFNDLARELIDILRVESDLSYNKCQNFADLVVTVVQERLQLTELFPVIDALRRDTLDVTSCLDTKRMRQCFQDLSEFCSDSQQRNWNLFEDKETIADNLKLLTSLTLNADERVTMLVIAEDDFRPLIDLVKFYQSETRLSIRILILEALRVLILLSPRIVSVLLTTVLPTELCQDFNGERLLAKKTKQFSLSLELLRLLFCTGEQIPFTLYDTLDETFLQHILDILDWKDDESEHLMSEAMCFLLAFNLHQANNENNEILRLLSCAQNTKTFAERLLILANRKEDPVWPYKNKEAPYESSVLVMLSSILNHDKAAKIFYANDIVVLVEIVLREISDLSPGQRRTKFLELLLLMARHSHFLESRLSEIKHILQHLELSSNDISNKEDVVLLAEIRKLVD